MLLEPNEAALFFKLMLPLQFFVNQKLGVLPKVKKFEKYVKVSMNDKFKVRNTLFENLDLMDEFIDENPHDIPLNELAAISKWKKFVAGDFYIERHLKNGSIFISDDEEVYEVVGLTTSLDEFFPKYTLPMRVGSATSIPFQNKVITDGFFVPYQIAFGGGIKGELKELYTEAKRKDKIIKTLT